MLDVPASGVCLPGMFKCSCLRLTKKCIITVFAVAAAWSQMTR
jgi:hypothetical protein